MWRHSCVWPFMPLQYRKSTLQKMIESKQFRLGRWTTLGLINSNVLWHFEKKGFSTGCNVLSFNVVQHIRIIYFLVFLTPIWSFSVNGIDTDYYDSLKIESLRVLVLFLSFRLDIKIKNVSFSSKNHVWWLSFSTAEWHYIRHLNARKNETKAAVDFETKGTFKVSAHWKVNYRYFEISSMSCFVNIIYPYTCSKG